VLHEVPREEWKERLTELLAGGLPDRSGRKWPWGPTLLRPVPGVAPNDVVAACERKATVDDGVIVFTVSGADLARWSEEGFFTAAEDPVVMLDPEALRADYRVEELVSLDGRFGPYQQVLIRRGA